MFQFAPIKQPDSQLRVVAFVLAAGFCVLLAGLWYVQVFSSKKFSESLEDQAVRTVRIPAVRGKILDRNGQPFAENRPTYNIELYLAELGKHFNTEYMRLRPVGARLTRSEREALEWTARYHVVSNITTQVGDWLQQPQVIDQKKFQRHYNEVRALPISILQNLNAVQVARFAERPGVFPGLDLEIQPLRVYPHGSMAAHVLGSLTRDESSQEEEDAFYHYRLPDWKGVTGMEGVFDGQLRGVAGTKSMTVNRLGYRQHETVLRTPEPGTISCSRSTSSSSKPSSARWSHRSSARRRVARRWCWTCRPATCWRWPPPRTLDRRNSWAASAPSIGQTC